MDTERFNRALSLLNSGDAAAALQEFSLLGNLESNREEKSSLLLNQVPCLMSLGRIEEARQRWLESAAYGRNLYTDYIDIFLCLMEDKTDEALQKLAEFVNDREDLARSDHEDLYSDAAEEFGYLLFEKQRYDDAIEPFKRALFNPETRRAQKENSLYLAMCYIQTDKLDVAERTFAQILPIDCEDQLWPTVQYQLGRLFYKKGSYARARKAFELSQLSTPEEDLRANASLWLSHIDGFLPPGKQDIA